MTIHAEDEETRLIGNERKSMIQCYGEVPTNHVSEAVTPEAAAWEFFERYGVWPGAVEDVRCYGRCPACEKPILGEAVFLDGHPYHPACSKGRETGAVPAKREK